MVAMDRELYVVSQKEEEEEVNKHGGETVKKQEDSQPYYVDSCQISNDNVILSASAQQMTN